MLSAICTQLHLVSVYQEKEKVLYRALRHPSHHSDLPSVARLLPSRQAWLSLIRSVSVPCWVRRGIWVSMHVDRQAASAHVRVAQSSGRDIGLDDHPVLCLLE